MQWMRNAIPDFPAVIRPMSNFLERVYAQAEKRTKTAAGRVILSVVGWNAPEAESFNQCKTILENQVVLAHRDNNPHLCV